MTTEIIVCPICNKTIWSEATDPYFLRSRLPSRSPHGSAMLTEMVLESQRLVDDKRRRAELACSQHFEDAHARRYRLWQKHHWKWLMTRKWPWSQPVIGDGLFEVKT